MQVGDDIGLEQSGGRAGGVEWTRILEGNAAHLQTDRIGNLQWGSRITQKNLTRDWGCL